MSPVHDMARRPIPYASCNLVISNHFRNRKEETRLDMAKLLRGKAGMTQRQARRAVVTLSGCLLCVIHTTTTCMAATAMTTSA